MIHIEYNDSIYTHIAECIINLYKDEYKKDLVKLFGINIYNC